MPFVFSQGPVLLLIVYLFLPAGCQPPTSEEGPVENFTFTPESPPAYASEGLRLATLNTEFMFDGRGGEGGTTFAHKGDPDAARRHRAEIGEVIRMLDADLVALQEVENREVMERLVEESLGGMGYSVYFVQGKDTFTGQDVGLLARVPIDTVGRIDRRVRVGSSEDTYGVSKNLFARFQLDGRPTTLVTLHFLANPTSSGRRARREAQAAVIDRFVEQELQAGRAVAIAGDVNDFDAQIPDLAASRPITDVLARLKSAGEGPADDLRSVMARVPQRERFTSHYDKDDDKEVDTGELSALDHILLSPWLYERVREVTYVQAHDPTKVTDHFPIVVTLGLEASGAGTMATPGTVTGPAMSF